MFVSLSNGIITMGKLFSHQSETSGNALNFANLKVAAQNMSRLTEKAKVILSINRRSYSKISAMAHLQNCTSVLSSSSRLCTQTPQIRVAVAGTGSASKGLLLMAGTVLMSVHR